MEMIDPPDDAGQLANFFEHSMGDSGLDRVLGVVRRHLSMDVAFVSRFQGDTRIIDHVDSEGYPLLNRGQSIPIDAGYCMKVVNGELPEFIPNTAHIPAAIAIPETHAIPIGSHLSTPIVLEDKRVFGTLCCFSHHPVASLTERDMDMLRAFSEFLGFYFDSVERQKREQESVAQDIRAAMENDALSIVFQPVYGIAKPHIHGFECLSRFNMQPGRSPDKWFNAAHSVGLGLDLELHAIDKALKELARFPDDISFNLNCSPELIISSRLLPLLGCVDASRIVLEITEHDIVNDYAALAEALNPVRALGVRVAVDDAGAGYSSMRHILNLQPDFIKLDISLTKTIDQDKNRKALAKGLINFAHEIGSEVVAEGVEAASELETLQQLGVDYAQGYYLAKPMQRDDATRLAYEHVSDATHHAGDTAGQRLVNTCN
ncbi:sensor domain-containing phosphodiesterase [Xanthomonas albilineans]|uniref:sensor domain-containing phosphodiesterase n=1 Tax=Xanthomonas albilineans TaxID=29447 RepID=UPI0005F313A8|nr:EAL domain-containing protein [Xanthomonas albilineans]